jgi:hypothetical protein
MPKNVQIKQCSYQMQGEQETEKSLTFCFGSEKITLFIFRLSFTSDTCNEFINILIRFALN